MAYYNQNNQQSNGAQGMNGQDDEEQQNAGSQVPLASGPVSNVPAAGGAAPAPTAPRASASGMAPGFQNYTRANQGGGVNKLANAAQSTVQNLGQKADSTINLASNAFGKKMDAGTLANRQQAVQDVANAVAQARQVTAPVPPAPAPAAASPAPQDVTGTRTASAPPAAAPQAPVAPLSALDQSQVNRFKEVINAKYAGPQSLREAGLNQDSLQTVNDANQAIKNSKTAQGREALLRSMFEKRGDYARGLNKLDTAFLNSSQDAVKGLQNKAQQFGDLQNKLVNAETSAVNQARNRTEEIKNIQNQAREAFTQGKTAEEAATEQRLDKVVQDWDKLPQYLRDTLNGKMGTTNDEIVNKFKADNGYANANRAVKQAEIAYKASLRNPGSEMAKAAKDRLNSAQHNLAKLNSEIGNLKQQKMLSQEEADLLGIKSGEGLYNLGDKAIKTAAVAGRDELVSRDEQLRQAVLSQLAGLDTSNRLNTNLKYGDATKAGTKSAFDAYDQAATRRALDEAEKDFLNNAKNSNFMGNDGNLRHNSVNLLDALKTAGYNTTGAGEQNLLSREDLMSQAGFQGTGDRWNAGREQMGTFLGKQGFNNRVNVEDTQTLRDRSAALQNFLNSLDQTNRKK